MFKKLCCIILSLIFILSLMCGCEKEEKLKIYSGVPEAPGDIFSLPTFATATAGAPRVSEVTRQADNDDTIIVAGKGFKSEGVEAYVYAQTTDKNGSSYKCDFKVIDDSLMHIVVGKNVPYGAFGVYVKNKKGNSNIQLLNIPRIWFVGLTNVSAGAVVDVYGENLTTDNADKSNIMLVSENEHCYPKIVYADPYKVSFEVPDLLDDGKQYEIWLHNGHGGDYGFAVAEEKLNYSKDKKVSFGGKKIDVTKYGADPKDVANDDTDAIKKAIDAASDGDTIYFPKGTYLCSSNIEVERSLKFIGDGANESTISITPSYEGNLFELECTPYEFADLGFYHDSSDKKINSSFIHARGDEMLYEEPTLYIHDCFFDQVTSPEFRSKSNAVDVVSLNSVVLENNTFDATIAFSARLSKQIFIRNNKFHGDMYVGPYYGQDTVMLNTVEQLDVSGNKFYGKDSFTDKSGNLETDDRTVGRAIVVQGSGSNMYFADNDMKASGLPGYNAGELILLENLSTEYEGNMAFFDKSSMTLPEGLLYQPSVGHIVTVGNGMGKYQYRVIKGCEGKKVTFERDWDVVPNDDSYVVITNCYLNVAVYNNSFMGYSNYKEIPSATCGIQIYGSTHNLFYKDNLMQNLPEGICITNRYVENENGKFIAIIYWCIYEGNAFREVADPIRYYMVGMNGSGSIPLHNNVGNSIRRNTFDIIPDFKGDWAGEGGIGIKMGQAPVGDGGKIIYKEWRGSWIIGASIENNTFKACEITPIYFYMHQGSTVIRNNIDEKGKPITYKIREGCNGPLK